MSVVTRFAPSPTGSLHVGGARTALYCLLHARKHDGTFLLRIEDTDQARSTDDSTQGILRDLLWLGLDWDEGPDKDGGHGPYFQSQRLDTYGPVFDQLLDADIAYEAWETREELDALRDRARADKQDFRYKRRSYSDEELARFRTEGRTPVLRLMAPAHALTVHDDILGEVTVEADHLEDIVIRKADGFPTYHFAVVVDDTGMNVTQILRGQEHLMNTPKHLGLYLALGWSTPRFGHLPLIFNPEGSKMSKRDKAKAARLAARQERDQRKEAGWDWLAARTGIDAHELEQFSKKKNDSIETSQAIAAALGLDLPMIEVMDFRKAGYLPEALNNYLALLGWNPGAEPDGSERELFTLDELIARWDVGRVGKTSARFDPDKLRWMNGEYLRSMDDARLEQRLSQWFEVAPSRLQATEPGLRARILDLFKPRAHTFAELEATARYVWEAPTSYDDKAVKKWVLKANGLDLLGEARQVLATCEWTESGTEAALTGLVEAQGIKMGAVAQPLRVALSGAAATPGLWETLLLFPRDEVLRRIDTALAALSPTA